MAQLTATFNSHQYSSCTVLYHQHMHERQGFIQKFLFGIEEGGHFHVQLPP